MRPGSLNFNVETIGIMMCIQRAECDKERQAHFGMAEPSLPKLSQSNCQLSTAEMIKEQPLPMPSSDDTKSS